jgi:hypothetical protein
MRVRPGRAAEICVQKLGDGDLVGVGSKARDIVIVRGLLLQGYARYRQVSFNRAGVC